MIKHLQTGVWRHKKRQIRNLVQICLLRLKAGGENVGHNTRRCVEFSPPVNLLICAVRKSVYLAKKFGAKIEVGVI